MNEEGADRLSADKQIAGNALIPIVALVGVH
jgi:hypothetical protein